MIFTAAQLSALPVLDTCDVLIAGGGVAGVAAALSAARAGAKVTLIEREYALGGLATLGPIICRCATAWGGRYPSAWPRSCCA